MYESPAHAGLSLFLLGAGPGDTYLSVLSGAA
jgi:hypothetical protein